MTNTPTPISTTAQLDQDHPYFGHGGSYLFDPATGETTLLERAGLVAETAAPVTANISPIQPE